jgi:hypothetical protein
MSFTPFVIVLGVLALVTAMLIVWRTVLGFNEDDSLHLPAGELGAERQQIQKAHQLEVVEHWGKILSGLTVAYWLGLLCVFAYKQLY